ncbi:ATP-dependent zinc protease family protein [Microbulbifer sediminum]|uniref:ATP-dependent zinc protease family protein n=1 Tax=Microbulbifer sediminum TaxID=2904250 RepID=UPI001F3FF256|nr:RimK/LysX family protein [Microbulbifer sediminum]
MRFFPILCLLLASQLIVGCESFTLRGPWSEEPGTAIPEQRSEETGPALDAAAQCPEPQEVVCAEPEVKVVERVIERTYEKVVEVPVAKDKLVLGDVEVVAIEPGGVTLKALIDTGAPTSSLSVKELKPFERDGKDWVRFQLAAPGDDEPVTVELPIKRHVRVERPGFGSQRRPIVNMSLTVGEVTHMVEVNLAERNGMDYRLLVGRNFLKDAAVVDVSRREVQGEPRLPVSK